MLEGIAINELTFVLALIVAFIVVIEAVLRIRKWHNRKEEDKEYDKFLEAPFKNIKFLIPTKAVYEIKYYNQDEKEHGLKELELPTNFKDIIFLIWTPKENFETAEMYFGFEGEKGKKPKIIAYKNPFVIRPKSLKLEWYQDWHEDFHLVKEKCYFKHEYYVAGFQIKTFDKGIYDMYVKFPIICDRYKSIRERRQKKVVITKLKIIVK